MNNLTEFTASARERFAGDKDMIRIIDEIDAEPSQDSRILGTLLTLSLCWNGEL